MFSDPTRPRFSAVADVDEAWFVLPDGRRFPLGENCAIGRQADNDLALEADTLSRHHALVTRGAMGYFVADLQSRNGTYVNRRLLTRPVLLRDRDEISLGGAAIRFRCTLRNTSAGPALADTKTTQLKEQLQTRLCWLLVLDIEGHAALSEQAGSETALRQLQAWIAGARPLIEKNSGRINRYIGDAILAYWPCEEATPANVLDMFRALEAWRAHSPLPFRAVVHHGSVLFTRSEHGEELAGRDVTFVFRMEKIAKGFGSHAMLSPTAARTLGIENRCESYGRSAVDGMSDFFVFYALPADFAPANARDSRPSNTNPAS